MTYEQMFRAMRGLGVYPALHMRNPGDWYVSLSGVEIANGVMLSSCGASGRSPEGAIEKTWDQITGGLPETARLVVNAYGDGRREVRWNGFMWEDMPDPLKVTPVEATQRNAEMNYQKSRVWQTPRNWHSIVGPNGMCECGVKADGTVIHCGEMLKAEREGDRLTLRQALQQLQEDNERLKDEVARNEKTS